MNPLLELFNYPDTQTRGVITSSAGAVILDTPANRFNYQHIPIATAFIPHDCDTEHRFQYTTRYWYLMSDTAVPISNNDSENQKISNIINVRERDANLPDTKTQRNKPNKKIWTVKQKQNYHYNEAEYEWRKINRMLKTDGRLLHERTNTNKMERDTKNEGREENRKMYIKNTKKASNHQTKSRT